MTRKEVPIAHTGRAGDVGGVRRRGDVSGAEKVTPDTLSFLSFTNSSFCLEMGVKIENPTKFLNAKNVRPAEIYRQVSKFMQEMP
jgi:hypothetical protein